MKNDDRIVELESRLAFQEHSLNELNEVVTAQQEQIDALRAALQLLESRLSLLAAQAGEPSAKPEDEIPPHY